MNKSVKSVRKFHFVEKRFAPLWILISSIIFSLSLSLAFIARVGVPYSLVVALVTSSLCIYLWNQSQSTIILSDEFLFVGRAKIERLWISNVEVHKAEEFLHRIRTRYLPTDYYSLRNLHYGGVVIEISDNSDPHKHWVISMKHGNQLKEILQRGKSE